MKSLDRIFNAKSIAVIGASRRANSVGHGILKNLITGGVFQNKYCEPYDGKVYPINPNAEHVLGLKCHNSVLDIEEKIDLAIFAIPARLVLQAIEECVKKRVKGGIIVSAGFGELNEEGRRLQEEVVKKATAGGMRLIGPNCLGVIRTSNNMNASFAPSMPPKGRIAFISQSGALADSIIDWALRDRYGFSTVISYGNGADLDASDFLEWLGEDNETNAIAMYIEGLKDGRKFINVAKKVVQKKPVVVIKAGKSESGQKAVSSHTGSLAGGYAVYKAAFKKAGIIVAETVEELFDITKALSDQPAIRKNSIAIVTNGGGAGVLTADYCEEFGVCLATLKDSTIKKLEDSKKMHPAYSRRNPLDIVGDALPDRYEVAINTLLSESYISGLIVLQTLQTMTDPVEDAKIVIDAHKRYPTKPIICVYMGGKFSLEGIQFLEEHCIPDYNDPRKAARAMKALIEYGKIKKGKIVPEKCEKCF
ncbi:MAG: CoA-binding protein [Candidatus Woesearchaeota archaeon]